MEKPLANPEMLLEEDKFLEEYKFVEEYKAFERVVCNASHLSNLSWVLEIDFTDSVFSLEKYIISEDVKDKIKVCRMLRNYIQHHPDAASFLSVTAEETAFLKEKTEEILSLDGMAKDVMVRCSVALTDKNTLFDFAAAMSAKNLSVYPYLDKKGDFSVLTQNDLVRALGNGKTPKQKIGTAVEEKDKVRIGFAFQNTPVASLPDAEVVIVLTQAKDKAIGVIVRDKC